LLDRDDERNCSLRIICPSIWNHFYESFAERFNDDNYKRELSSARQIPMFSGEASWTMKSNGTIVNISTISWEKRWHSPAQMEVLSAKASYNSFGEISDVKASNFNWKNWSLPLLDLISLFHHHITSPHNPRYYRDLWSDLIICGGTIGIFLSFLTVLKAFCI